jgi:hypothetical protein
MTIAPEHLASATSRFSLQLSLQRFTPDDTGDQRQLINATME